MFVSERSQMVEVIITATGNNQRTYFQDQPQLQSYRGNQTVYIKAVETFSNTTIVQSPLTSGSTTATPADIQNATLTLVNAGTELQQLVPLAVMNRIWADPGGYTPYTWQPYLLKDVFEVDWTKSYVTTLTAPAAQPFSYLFLFHYSYMP